MATNATSDLALELRIVTAQRDGLKQYIDNLGLCPDHRDKYDVRGRRCIVCLAEERTRRERVET